MAFVYDWNDSMISGALYQRVATYSGARSDRRTDDYRRPWLTCHVSRILFRIKTEASRKTEIANLELTVGVNEQIARFEITVKNVGRVDVFETAENLVDEGLEMCIR